MEFGITGSCYIQGYERDFFFFTAHSLSRGKKFDIVRHLLFAVLSQVKTDVTFTSVQRMCNSVLQLINAAKFKEQEEAASLVLSSGNNIHLPEAH